MNRARITDFFTYIFSSKKDFKKYLKKLSNEDLAYLGLLIRDELERRDF